MSNPSTLAGAVLADDVIEAQLKANRINKEDIGLIMNGDYRPLEPASNLVAGLEKSLGKERPPSVSSPSWTNTNASARTTQW